MIEISGDGSSVAVGSEDDRFYFIPSNNISDDEIVMHTNNHWQNHALIISGDGKYGLRGGDYGSSYDQLFLLDLESRDTKWVFDSENNCGLQVLRGCLFGQ